MRKVKRYILYTWITGVMLSMSHCMAWPGFTGILGLFGGSKSQSPVFLLPAKPQPQDSPQPSDNPDGILDPVTSEIPINPNPGNPELIAISRTGNVVSESGTSVDVRIRLSREPSQNVRIHSFQLSHSGEISYTPVEFTFTPANWNIDQVLTITGLPDSIQDGDREVTIQLGSMDSQDSRFHNVDAGEILVLNTDIDSAGVALYPLSGLETSENGSTYLIHAVLNSRPTHTVTFTVQATPGSEVVASPSSLTFTPANWNLPQTITLTGADDSIQDGDQPFTVQLVSGSSLDPLYDGMVSSVAHGLNRDNDTAGVFITTTASVPYTVSEDGTSITFKVRLSSQPIANVTIPIYSLNPGEGQPSASNLTFSPANWNLEQNLVVTGIDDPDIDGDKLFTVRLDTPASSDPNYSSLNPLDISMTNLDNDVAGLVFTNHLNLTTGEDGTNANFRVRLRSRPTANVTVQIASSDTTEGTVHPSSLTFTPSNWNTNQTVNINGVNDSLIDGDVWYEIQFPTILSADPNYNNLIVNSLPVVNLDDDTPGVMFLGASNLQTNENQTGVTTFQVRLKTRPSHNVRFPLISSDNPNEGVVTPSDLVFTPANWNVPQTITIQPVRDWVVDSDAIYQIVFSNLDSFDPLYNNLPVNSVPVTNRNSDAFGYIFSPAFNGINLVVADSGLKDSFTIRLNSKPTANVTIPISVLDPTRVNVTPSLIEFTPFNWNIPVIVEVEGIYRNETTPANTTIGLRLGVWNSTLNKYYPSGSSDYASFAFSDRNGTSTDNGILNVRRFNTQRPVTIIHPLIANTSSVLTTTESGGQVPLMLKLGWEPSHPVTIQITSTNPTEGLPNLSTLVIQPHEWQTFHTILIVGQNDDILDGSVDYEIAFQVSSADLNFHNFPLANVKFRNQDNNTNRLIVSPANSSTSPFITTKKPGPRHTFSFTLRLNAMPNGNVTFPLVVNNPSQGVLDKTSLVFNSSNWNIPQTVTLTALDDSSPNSVNYTITAGPSTANPATDHPFTLNNNALTIHVRNTSPGFTLSPANGNTGEWGRQASFTFRLNSPPSASVTCHYYIDNELEGRGITGTINTSFPIPNVVRSFTRTASNWNSNFTITVEGVDDLLIDGDQSFQVVFLPCSSADPDYDGLTPPSVPFINEDND